MNKPRLYSFASATPLYGYLASTMIESASKEFDVQLIRGTSKEQIQYKEKAQIILSSLIKEAELGNNVMIWADADCLFLQPCVDEVLTLLENHDAAFQSNGVGELATGFFAMKTTIKMIAFWQRVVDAKVFYLNPWSGFDEAAAQSMKNQMDFIILPENEYWSPCCFTKQQAHRDWQLTGLPKEAKMVHLSCVFSNEKARIMDQIIATTKHE